MGLEVRVSMHVNVNGDFLILSPEGLLEIAQNVRFLAKHPIPVFDKLKGEIRDEGYREIRVARGFKSMEVTEEIEREPGLKTGVYNSISVPADFVRYRVYDFRWIKEDKSIPERLALVGMEWYSEEEMRELRGDKTS